MASDTTEASAAVPASTRVVGNFDLFESILLELPIRDLLLTKRVSKSWAAMQNKSDRIQKALFLKPFSDKRIYYPDCSNPHWYLNLSGNDNSYEGVSHDEDGGVSLEPSKWFQDGGSGVPPADYAEQCRAYQDSSAGDNANQKVSAYVSDNAMAVKRKGSSRDSKQQQQQKRKKLGVYVFNSPFDKFRQNKTADGADDGQSSTITQQTYGKLLNNLPSDPNAQFDHLEYEPYYAQITLKQSEATSSSKLPVSRMTGPFINPFCELFVERFYRDSRGAYFPAEMFEDTSGMRRRCRSPVPIRCAGDKVLEPPVRYDDGTTYDRSRASRAGMRYVASWRKMLPFSSITTSVEVECFDFGDLSLFDDEGMLLGTMMEQLFKHWSTKCPDCCIFPLWFGEFIRDFNPVSDIAFRFGNHGVRRLPGGLNNTGWETLAKLRAGQVELTGEIDVVKPY